MKQTVTDRAVIKSILDEQGGVVEMDTIVKKYRTRAGDKTTIGRRA